MRTAAAAALSRALIPDVISGVFCVCAGRGSGVQSFRQESAPSLESWSPKMAAGTGTPAGDRAQYGALGTQERCQTVVGTQECSQTAVSRRSWEPSRASSRRNPGGTDGSCICAGTGGGGDGGAGSGGRARGGGAGNDAGGDGVGGRRQGSASGMYRVKTPGRFPRYGASRRPSRRRLTWRRACW